MQRTELHAHIEFLIALEMFSFGIQSDIPALDLLRAIQPMALTLES